VSPPNRILAAVFAVAIAIAIAEAVVPSLASQTGSVDLLASLIFSVLAFAWVKADARARQITVPPGSALLAALIIPVGVPVYLIRARGWRRGLIGTAKAFGFIIAVTVTYVVISHTTASLKQQP